MITNPFPVSALVQNLNELEAIYMNFLYLSATTKTAIKMFIFKNQAIKFFMKSLASNYFSNIKVRIFTISQKQFLSDILLIYLV